MGWKDPEDKFLHEMTDRMVEKHAERKQRKKQARLAEPHRRQLRFDTLADAVREAETLLAAGYDKNGTWSLGQCCGHLANWLTYPLDGFPKVPLLLRPLLWMMKMTVGKRKLKTYLADRSFPAGAPTVPQSVPPATAEDADGVAKLKAAVERFTAHTGPVLPSPLFGAMTKETAEQIQRVHCAHHLSFLVPKGG